MTNTYKHPFTTDIRGITTHQNRPCPMKTLDSTSTRSRRKWHHGSSTPAIPHVNAGFRKHQLDTQVATQHINTSHSACRRSIPQEPAGDTHPRDHNTSKPAIPHADAPFHKHPLQMHLNGINTHQKQPFSMYTLVSTAPARDKHQWHQHTTTSHSACRRSTPQETDQDTHE